MTISRRNVVATRLVAPGTLANRNSSPRDQPAILRNAPIARAVRADQANETLDASLLASIASISSAAEDALSGVLRAAAAAQPPAPEPAPDAALARKVAAAVESLQSGLLERETEVRPCARQRACVQAAAPKQLMR